MTTAGRPTWNPAVGGEGRSQGGNRVHAPIKQFSSRDLRSHTKLKLRQPGQNAPSDLLQRDLKAELESKEKHTSKRKIDELEEENEEVNESVELIEDGGKKEEIQNIDKDDSDDSESESEDEEEDTKELLRELEKIKKEREEEQRIKMLEELNAKAQEEEAEALTSNPLLAAKEDFTVKKRWYDDTVFKNQARDEVTPKKRFINDTIRNDFHRKFLAKYIQ